MVFKAEWMFTAAFIFCFIWQVSIFFWWFVIYSLCLHFPPSEGFFFGWVGVKSINSLLLWFPNCYALYEATAAKSWVPWDVLARSSMMAPGEASRRGCLEIRMLWLVSLGIVCPFDLCFSFHKSHLWNHLNYMRQYQAITVVWEYIPQEWEAHWKICIQVPGWEGKELKTYSIFHN